MAQKVQTLLIDDLDGKEAEDTVRFGLDGAEYEIDLSAKHSEAMRKALEPYVSAARRASGSVARRPGAGAGAAQPPPGLTLQRSGSGPRLRASRSKTADGSPPNWSSSSRRRRSNSRAGLKT
jgi:Lsr2